MVSREHESITKHKSFKLARSVQLKVKGFTVGMRELADVLVRLWWVERPANICETINRCPNASAFISTNTG